MVVSCAGGEKSTSVKSMPLLIRISMSSVMAARGSPGDCHAGTGAGSFIASLPSRTAMP